MNAVENAPAAPPPPDVARDRVCMVWGGAFFLQNGEYVGPTDRASAYATMASLDGEVVRRVPIHHTTSIGTVAELAEQFREGLEDAFWALANRHRDGTQGDIAMLGEPSLRKHVEVLERAGLNHHVEAAPRGDLDPSEYELDLLRRLSWVFADDTASPKGGASARPAGEPGPSPDVFERMIAGLQRLRAGAA
jgi:hypothetical protein